MDALSLVVALAIAVPFELFDDEHARGYAAAAAVLLPFRSPFDDWR